MDVINTLQYSVYITDKNNSVNGSGILFYPGGDKLFVFTCAHVVYGFEAVRVTILRPINIVQESYEAFVEEVPQSQILYSPNDVITQEGEVVVHSEDYAIIELQKTESFNIEPTAYFFGESIRNEPFYAQGFPGGIPEGIEVLDALFSLRGFIASHIADKKQFTICFTDSVIDQGNRIAELKGLSGAPVWDARETKENRQSLLGLVCCAYGQWAQLGKVFAVKWQPIRVLMKDKFGITIERKLDAIPITDIAGDQNKPALINEFKMQPKKGQNSLDEKWAEEQFTACRLHIDELQLQKAIDMAKTAIAEERFENCSQTAQRRLMQLLLYCYEIGDLDSEFDTLELEMRSRGLLKKYDVLRHLTRSFMKKEYGETIAVAEECMNDANTGKELLAYAKSFRLLAKAYTENLPVQETIGKLLDEHENFIYEKEGVEDSALIYQMIGYVYGEKYHDYINAVRFANRSYQIGFDNIVLETVGAAYYYLGIADATREDDTVDYKKLDNKSLYKAREIFLTIIKKADTLYWAGTVRRMGLCIYNTFVFLNDNYRILTIYPEIKKYINQKDDIKLWRDIEMKQAKVLAYAGRLNLSEYLYITETDEFYLETLVKTGQCSAQLEQATVQFNLTQTVPVGLEEYLKNTIVETENSIEMLDKKDRLPIYVHLMNMYGRGMLLFGWQEIGKLKNCFENIKEYGDSLLMETMENFIFEFEAPLAEVIERFRTTFEKKRDIISWQELQHLYVRHGMLAESDAMYRELLTKRKELIADGPEYAYRAYIDYITLYHRDLKDALQCYLDAKEAFKDTDIEGFWELELMFLTNTFNDPDRFEVILKPFVEKGLLPEEKYHRMVFIANLVNLREKKAGELYAIISQYPHIVNPYNGMSVSGKEEIHYLSWIGAIKPGFIPPANSMQPMKAAEAVNRFKFENWHRSVNKALQHQFGVEKKIVADAWTLFILEETKGLEYLHRFDCVYVSHFTVIRLLEELSRVNSLVLRHIIDFIETDSVCQIVSPGFRAQIEVRKNANYNETATAVALGIEKDCVVVLGDLDLEDGLVDKYSQRIIRTDEMDKLFGM